MTPEPPNSLDDGPDALVRILYHGSDGDVRLKVFNGPVGCCLAAVGNKEGHPVTLPDGSSAHHLTSRPGSGTGILWWERDGTYISTEILGLDLSREELLRIAASMSKTAKLGPTEPRPSQPSQSPPTPDFPILRPGWLPASVKRVDEEHQTDPWRGETDVILSFDHRPEDDEHEALTLMEQKAGATGGEAIPDPQATTERIGGREVTVVRRADACITMSWEQDGLSLTLTNAYDPPGQILYPCEQMRRIVGSVGE